MVHRLRSAVPGPLSLVRRPWSLVLWLAAALLLLPAGAWAPAARAAEAPTITEVRALTPEAEAGDLVLEIAGSGFGPGVVLTVDGAPVPTQVQTAEGLEARIPALLLVTARDMALRVVSPGAGISDPWILTLANPAPRLTGIEAPPLRAGRGPTAVRVRGQDFRPDSVVQLGDGALETRFITPQELEALLPGEALAAAGTLRVGVQTPGPGGGRSEFLELDIQPPPPFGGRFVVFMSNRGGVRNHLYLLDRMTGKLDGLEEANRHGASDGYPSISADGRLIVFQSDRAGGQQDIFLFDRVTRRLDGLPEANHPAAFDGFPSLSPDGRFIVFESDRLHRRPKIFLFDRATRRLEELEGANQAGADDGLAAISD